MVFHNKNHLHYQTCSDFQFQDDADAYNIAFVKARQTELGCAELYKSAVVQVLGGQALKSVPSQMLLRCP
jgi:hypothetical protein